MKKFLFLVCATLLALSVSAVSIVQPPFSRSARKSALDSKSMVSVVSSPLTRTDKHKITKSQIPADAEIKRERLVAPVSNIRKAPAAVVDGKIQVDFVQGVYPDELETRGIWELGFYLGEDLQVGLLVQGVDGKHICGHFDLTTFTSNRIVAAPGDTVKITSGTLDVVWNTVTSAYDFSLAATCTDGKFYTMDYSTANVVAIDYSTLWMYQNKLLNQLEYITLQDAPVVPTGDTIELVFPGYTEIQWMEDTQDFFIAGVNTDYALSVDWFPVTPEVPFGVYKDAKDFDFEYTCVWELQTDKRLATSTAELTVEQKNDTIYMEVNLLAEDGNVYHTILKNYTITPKKIVDVVFDEVAVSTDYLESAGVVGFQGKGERYVALFWVYVDEGVVGTYSETFVDNINSSQGSFFGDLTTGYVVNIVTCSLKIEAVEDTYALKGSLICEDEVQYNITISTITPVVPGTTLPVADFEDAGENGDWTLVNGTEANFWTIGNATAATGSRSLYITNDGSSYGYNSHQNAMVWVVLNKPIQGDVNISFDWKGQGESGCDYMQAYLIPAGTSVEAGYVYLPDGAFPLDNSFYGVSKWTHYQGCVSLGNREYNLAFRWQNDGSVGETPIAIDNVQVSGLGQTFHYSIQAGEHGYLDYGNQSGTYTPTCNNPNLYIEVYPIPEKGYKFIGWSDGVSDFYRAITIYQDTTITALFAQAERVRLRVGVASGCTEMGFVSGGGVFYEQEWASIQATPNDGYHFVEWSDGDANAERYIYLTSGTTLYATFAPGYYGGRCGEHLYWGIDNDTLYITGSGAMDVENYRTWKNDYHYLSGVVFPDGLTSIPAQAFYNDNGIYNDYTMQTIVIPATVEYIDYRAFAGCYNIRKWQYLGNNLELGYDILQSHNSIQFLQGPTALINDCNYRDEWYSLDTLIVTNGDYRYNYYDYNHHISYYDASKATSYGYYNGYYRTSLLPYRTFFFPEDIVEIGDFALMNARYLGGVTIPAGVTYIGESAFEECRSLDSVVFAGSNLETIGDWAFYNCHELKKINIPEGTREVGKAAFFNCTYLSELTIPSTMQRIADNGFGACSKMQRMYVNALVPPTIDAKTFEDVNRDIPVFVPKGTLERYQGDPYWSEFFNMEEYDAPTGILNTSADTEDNVRKVLKDGQVLIIRGDKTYTVLGDKL